MQEIERVLVRHDPCPWLPQGGVAEVVLAPDSSAPEPTVMVRLLLTSGSDILAVERDGSRGIDIPSAVVGQDAGSTLSRLAADVLTTSAPLTLLGFVCNTVNGEETSDYPWPVPLAHFVVWHCDVERSHATQGVWLSAEEARRELGERHWWPLAEALKMGELVPDAIGKLHAK